MRDWTPGQEHSSSSSFLVSTFLKDLTSRKREHEIADEEIKWFISGLYFVHNDRDDVLNILSSGIAAAVNAHTSFLGNLFINDQESFRVTIARETKAQQEMWMPLFTTLLEQVIKEHSENKIEQGPYMLNQPKPQHE